MHTAAMAHDEEAARRGRMLAVLLVLALLSVADGWYLASMHVEIELGKPGAAAVCHQLNPNGGCDITGGRYGEFFGIPVALFGMGGALATAIVTALALARRKEAIDSWRSAATALALFSVGASVVMAGLSFAEGSYCPFCVIWYGLNIGMALAAWSAMGPGAERRLPALVRRSIGAPLLVVVAVMSLVVAWGLRRDNVKRAELIKGRDAYIQFKIAESTRAGKKDFLLAPMPLRGPDDADVTIVEVADFECPFCKKLWEAMHEFEDNTDLSVRFAFVHYPLDRNCNPAANETMHPHACAAAIAAECARMQDKFWEYGDMLFDNQKELEDDDLEEYAEEVGLDMDEFRECRGSEDAELRVTLSIAQAYKLEVSGTPTFFVNNFQFVGALEPFGMIVDGVLEYEKNPPPEPEGPRPEPKK